MKGIRVIPDNLDSRWSGATYCTSKSRKCQVLRRLGLSRGSHTTSYDAQGSFLYVAMGAKGPLECQGRINASSGDCQGYVAHLDMAQRITGPRMTKGETWQDSVVKRWCWVKTKTQPLQTAVASKLYDSWWVVSIHPERKQKKTEKRENEKKGKRTWGRKRTWHTFKVTST